MFNINIEEQVNTGHETEPQIQTLQRFKKIIIKFKEKKPMLAILKDLLPYFS